jgi:isoquinoline 1-oxidoreductase subunit alpha
MVTLTVNGEQRSVSVEEDTPLLWVLRDHLQLTGTKFGCGIAQCGACTVHLDGKPVRSCSVPLSALEGRSVDTIESLRNNQQLSVVQQAWLETDVAQCGYCQSGQIMSATALLVENPSPSDEEITQAMNGHVCRCGTYPRIRRAIHLAAERLAQEVKA